MCISLRPSTYFMGSSVNLGSIGVTGVKRSFSLKMLLLVHIIQHDHKIHTCSSAWDPLPMLWVKYKSGVIWGHRGQKVIFSKNATSAKENMVLSALCNIVYPCYHVPHKYALTWDSQLHSLVQGQLGITSADRVRRLWRQHVSSFIYHVKCNC